jgi:hypothetical protein
MLHVNVGIKPNDGETVVPSSAGVGVPAPETNQTSAAAVAAKKEKLICELAKLTVSGNGSAAKAEVVTELKQELAPVFLEMVVELIAAGQLALHITCPSIQGGAERLVWAEPKTAKIVDGVIVV